MNSEKSENRFLSIITNFGCHYSCPYCVVTNCDIKVPKTTVEGLQGLERAIVENKCNWVSISGGGDPMYKLEEHIDWWNKFFEIIFGEELDGLDPKIELHTSYLPDTFDEDATPLAAFGSGCLSLSQYFRSVQDQALQRPDCPSGIRCDRDCY